MSEQHIELTDQYTETKIRLMRSQVSWWKVNELFLNYREVGLKCGKVFHVKDTAQNIDRKMKL